MSPSLPYARIALAIPVPELFDYRVPAELDASVVPGARVRVPFGRGVRIGYCIERSAEQRHEKPKSIEAVVDDAPLLEPDLLQLVRWTADYYLCSVGEVIEAAIPKGVREGKSRTIRWVRRSPTADSFQDRGNGIEGRARLLAILAERGPLPIEELLAAGEVGEIVGEVDLLDRHHVFPGSEIMDMLRRFLEQRLQLAAIEIEPGHRLH